MKKWIVGIDIGGTKISVTLGTRNSRVRMKHLLETRHGQKAKQSISEIVQAIRMLLGSHGLDGSELLGIGVSVPGPVNCQTGIIGRSPNLNGWNGIRIKAILERIFHAPVFIENDANAAALGELHFGEGKHVSDFIYITVSTGVGSGLVVNGRLVRGVSGGAGEIGHVTIVKDGCLCGCGKKGCLEAYASGTAIIKFVRRNLSHYASSLLHRVKPTQIDGLMVSNAARAGDKLAIEARRQAADYLGIGIGNVINLLNPKKIILGGGVMTDTHHFWAAMMMAIKREAWKVLLKDCKVVRSQLHGSIGDLGAFALVLNGRASVSGPRPRL